MTPRLLQGVGVVALIALVGGSVAALAIVRDRIHVTIADEENPAREPDELALVAADVAALREDVRALGEGVGAQFAELRVVPVAPPADPPVDPPADPPAPATPANAPTKRFLAFQLPSQGFSFAGRQRFSIVPSLSRVGFDAKSTLHDFSGVTTAIEGELTVDLARPGEDCRGAVRVKAATLDTRLVGRDEAMRELLEPSRFPEIRFDWTSFEATLVEAAEQRVTGVAGGRLTIHGTSLPVAMPVRVGVDASRRVTIEGETTIRMSEFGVRPPSRLGVISVEDEATMWIALRARSIGPAKEDG